MKKIIDWIGSDGKLHMLICAVITLALGYYIHFAAATAIAVFIGFLKEIVWDAKFGKGTFQWKDILCDLMGATAGFIYLLIRMQIPMNV